MSTTPSLPSGWLTSSFCDGGTCVGVTRVGDCIAITNTSQPGAGIATFTQAEWDAFVAGVKHGDFDTLA